MKWNQVESLVDQSKGAIVNFEIKRTNLVSGVDETLQMKVTPQMTATKSKYGEDIQAPRIGVSPEYVIPELFFNRDSILAKAGFEKMDRVIKIDSTKISTMEQLRLALSDLKNGEHSITLSRKGSEIQKSFVLPAGKGSVESRLGFLPIHLVIGRVDKGTPAEKAGLQANDFLVAINGSPLTKWEDVARIVRASGGQAVDVQINRDGKLIKIQMTPEKSVIQDPLMGKDNPLAAEPVYRIGIGPATNFETATFIDKSLNPIKWIKRGFSETWLMGSMTVTALYKIFTGQLSVKLLGSPIMIYKVAGNSYRMAGGGYQGWISFLTNLALLSIALGLMNLLPVPVLDGGHATFFTIEWIRGKPVSLRVMEIASQVGLFLLICLFVLVIFNDFHRYGWFDSIMKVFR
jgi:regulator of sigma E protease